MTDLVLEELLVREILGEVALEQFIQGKIARQELLPFIPTIKSLSEGYLSESTERLTPTDELCAQSYALYYLPINYRKILELLSATRTSFSGDSLRLLDFGCGPGTGTLAALASGIPLSEIVLVDRSKEMLSLAERLIASSKGAGDLPPVHMINRGDCDINGEFDLIIAANMLSEVGILKDESLLLSLASFLSEKGALLVVEPALQANTRRMMHMRDQLLAKRLDISPIFPCTHRDQCPMLEQSERDWCHGEVNWQEPRLVKQIDELTGFNKHRIKYCGFVFRRNTSLVTGYRIVSIPNKNKRGVEMLVCGKHHYGKILVEKKDKSDLGQSLKKSQLLSHVNEIPSEVV